MSSSIPSLSPIVLGGMSSFEYRPTDAALSVMSEVDIQEEPSEPEVKLTERSLSDRLIAERAAGFAEAELGMRQAFEQKAAAQAAKISQALAGFEQEQRAYFARVEAEVVQLALAIAGKILHREAQVDPMLLAAIVHLALGQLKDGSTATIRVRSEEANRWRQHLAPQISSLSVTIIEDPELAPGDCLLEAELGTVNFGLDAQLKEVERGFFDVLAQKPKA